MKKIFVGVMILFYSIFLWAEESPEQVVVTRIETGLKVSENYELDNVVKDDAFAIKSWELADDSIGGDTLDGIVEFSGKNSIDFGEAGDKYTYKGSENNKYVTIPVARNRDRENIKEGSFVLSVDEKNDSTKEIVKNIYIDQSFSLPASSMNLKEDLSYTSGNRFTYTESNSAVQQHLEAFKKQEYMIRIVKGSESKPYDVYNKLNKKNLISITNVDQIFDFAKTDGKYIDILFDNESYTDKMKVYKTAFGSGIGFMPGKIEVYGLPTGSYIIELYSFRYINELSTKGSMVITRESALQFTSTGIQEGINLLNFNSGSYPEVEAEVLTVSNVTGQGIGVAEQIGLGSLATAVSVSFTQNIPSKVFDSNGAEVTLDETGYDSIGKKYYRKVSIKYESPTKDENLNNTRKAVFSFGDKEAIAEYTPLVNIKKKLDYPHQTVIAKFSPDYQWKEGVPYYIEDRVMPKETLGYKQLKAMDGSVDGKNKVSIEKMWRGYYTDVFSMTQKRYNSGDYMWHDAQNASTNGLIFRKAISESKVSLKKKEAGKDSSEFIFYTTKGIKELKVMGEEETEADDKVTLTWTEEKNSNFNVNITMEKLIFRIVKISDAATKIGAVTEETYDVGGVSQKEELPINYINIYEKNQQIDDSAEEGRIETFVGANPGAYLDLVFDVGVDRETEGGNAIFSFSKDNRLQVVGLPRGDYIIQAYSLQDADNKSKEDSSFDYRVFTYGGYTSFEMGLPSIVTGDFASKNNLFMIDGINLYSGYNINTGESKSIEVNFVTKAEQSLNLTLNNLTARLDEAGEGGNAKATANKVTEEGKTIKEKNNIVNTSTEIRAVSNLELNKSTKADFQFPLDIIFLIDNSGSMQNEINAVKNGLKGMTKALNERGFDVAYNLITFGPLQNDFRANGYGWQRPVGNWKNKIYKRVDRGYAAVYKQKWFDGVYDPTKVSGESQKDKELDELINAFDNINATWGYDYGQENGAWAIDEGIKHLESNGRYLDYNNQIVTQYKKGYLPSNKWLILLTDENMDTQHLPEGYVSNNIVNKLSKKLKDDKINLTGIIHTDTWVNGQANKNLYINNIQNSEVVQQGNGWYRVAFDDPLNHRGVLPADTGEKYYTEFLLQGLGNLVNFYEMGENGEYVGDAFKHSVGNVGIVQRWTLKYDSPFVKSDGNDRQVIFSLKDVFKSGNTKNEIKIKPHIKNVNKDRYYTVPEQKITANFIRPESLNATGSESRLIKKDGKILIKGKAKSEYKNEKGQLVNYPIVSGQFTIKGKGNVYIVNNETLKQLDSNSYKVSIREVVDEEKKGKEYEVEVSFDANEFISCFGETDIKIDFLAQTKDNMKKISTTVKKITEKDPPKITGITLKNASLEGVLNELNSKTNLFSQSDITEAVTVDITDIPTGGAISLEEKLNVKTGDKIEITINVEDDTLTKWNKDFSDSNKNSVFRLGSTEAGSIVVDEKSITGVVTWNNSSNKDLQVRVTDDLGNKTDLLTFRETVVEPEAIKPVNIDGGPYYNAEGSGDADKALIKADVSNINMDEVLVTIVPFEYLPDESDGEKSETAYPSFNKNGETASFVASKGNSYLLGDGGYGYPKVLLLNKAGGVYGITGSTLDELLTNSFQGIQLKKFWVDTVAPRITSATILKTAENTIPSSYKNLLNQNGYTDGIIDKNYFKNGDTVKISIEANEYNYESYSYSDKTGLTGSGKISVTGTNNRKIEDSNYTVSGNPGSLSIVMTDKAGNVSDKFDISGNYSNAKPGTLKIEETKLKKVRGESTNIAFNKNLNLTGGSNAVAAIAQNSNLAKTPINNLGAFSLGLANGYREIEIVTFTSSGAINVETSKFVYDNDINYTLPEVVIGETSYEASGNYKDVVINFNKITELIGLDKFQVVDPSGDKIEGLTIGGVSASNLGSIQEISINTLSSKEPTSFSYNEKIKIGFKHAIQGNKKFKVKVIDELGNEKTVTAVIKISSGVNVIGKSSKSDNKKITSTINIGNNGKIDIKGRR